LAVCLVFGQAHPARAATTSVDVRVKMSDGVSVLATISGQSPLAARPVIVEFSPYGTGSSTTYDGSAYNYLLVQIRGTGDSDGTFDALGPRTQQDVVETLRWACRQSWSNGRLGLNGFSASAITIYNSLHLQLPCVKAAVLKSGTFELYRDLLVPGGINNILPGIGVLGLIGAPALEQGFDRLQRNPSSGLDVAAGLIGTGLTEVQHPTLDDWWKQRGFQGDANHLPILMIDGFYDVESRGAFQAYQALRGDGAHLLVVGGHDGAPVGTDDGAAASRAWLEHFVRGVDNGVQNDPPVSMLLSQGDRETYLGGQYTRFDTTDWPVPGTGWVPLSLNATRSGAATSLNDGSLTLAAPATARTQSYPALPSFPLNSDPPNTALVGAMGLNALTTGIPILDKMTLAGALGLSYTTKPLTQDVRSAGPLALDLWLSSTAPQTNIWAVLSDVSPDGTPHPLTVGRLNSDFPGVDVSRSLTDSSGQVVEPYGDYSTSSPAPIGQSRPYQVEFWPVGNVFKQGDRIRLDIVGSSAASLPGLPALNSVRVGGPNASRLLFPVLPGSDLTAALGG
jgi:putative CocE/NonD family hydrolase